MVASHDYVGAALIRRAGWKVWIVTGLAGNYEEGPANLIDLAQRDRRWLQGNLQHARLEVARGFHPVNRMHFALGILSYLASPLWLAFPTISAVIADRCASTGPLLLPVRSFPAFLHWSFLGQALCLFAFTLALLFLPKAFALLDPRARREEVVAFGGCKKLSTGICLETLVVTLLAPVLMLFRTQFIALTLCRKIVAWSTQRRGRAGTSVLEETMAVHWGQALFGLVAAVLSAFARFRCPGSVRGAWPSIN